MPDRLKGTTREDDGSTNAATINRTPKNQKKTKTKGGTRTNKKKSGELQQQSGHECDRSTEEYQHAAGEAPTKTYSGDDRPTAETAELERKYWEGRLEKLFIKRKYWKDQYDRKVLESNVLEDQYKKMISKRKDWENQFLQVEKERTYWEDQCKQTEVERTSWEERYEKMVLERKYWEERYDQVVSRKKEQKAESRKLENRADELQSRLDDETKRTELERNEKDEMELQKGMLEAEHNELKSANDKLRWVLDAEKEKAAMESAEHTEERDDLKRKLEELRVSHFRSVSSVGTGLEPISDQIIEEKFRALHDKVCHSPKTKFRLTKRRLEAGAGKNSEGRVGNVG